MGSYTPPVTQNQLATYRSALQEARASFDQSTKRLREIGDEAYLLNGEIGRLRRTITALAAMCSEEPMIDSLGITESCLEVMQAEKGTLNTAEVVRALEARGFDLASQKNATASVHAILSRLARKGKIQKIEADTTEKKIVFWRGPNFDPEYEGVPF
jgi:hypothetical protein